MTDNRPDIDPFSQRMSGALRGNDAFADQLRRDMESSIRPVAERAIADATKPYRRINFWLGITVAVLAVLSILEWVLLP